MELWPFLQSVRCIYRDWTNSLILLWWRWEGDQLDHRRDVHPVDSIPLMYKISSGEWANTHPSGVYYYRNIVSLQVSCKSSTILTVFYTWDAGRVNSRHDGFQNSNMTAIIISHSSIGTWHLVLSTTELAEAIRRRASSGITVAKCWRVVVEPASSREMSKGKSC